MRSPLSAEYLSPTFGFRVDVRQTNGADLASDIQIRGEYVWNLKDDVLERAEADASGTIVGSDAKGPTAMTFKRTLRRPFDEPTELPRIRP